MYLLSLLAVSSFFANNFFSLCYQYNISLLAVASRIASSVYSFCYQFFVLLAILSFLCGQYLLLSLALYLFSLLAVSYLVASNVFLQFFIAITSLSIRYCPFVWKESKSLKTFNSSLTCLTHVAHKLAI
jgi:hypothetical protein